MNPKWKSNNETLRSVVEEIVNDRIAHEKNQHGDKHVLDRLNVRHLE